MTYLKIKTDASEKTYKKIAINVHTRKFIVNVKLYFMVFREVLSILVKRIVLLINSLHTVK
jgi:hypothetical protein